MKTLVLVLVLSVCPAIAGQSEDAPALSDAQLAQQMATSERMIRQEILDKGNQSASSNLSVRDFIAIEAMSAIVAHSGITMSPESAAKWAYMYADAMLKRSRE